MKKVTIMDQNMSIKNVFMLNWFERSIVILMIAIAGAYLSKKYSDHQFLKTVFEMSNLESAIVVAMDSTLEFTPEKFYETLKYLNVKFPDIVMAQAICESGNFSSYIWMENNNAIGMKEAKLRPTTCRGSSGGYAYYDNWWMCAADYALWQASFAKDIKTKTEYLNLLGRIYAEDAKYVNKIDSISKTVSEKYD